ncbi:hypothetical protein PVAND_000795 [Polypedilum vanderplanki]|uniref:Protein unc-80-like protein n=1 Tax=Polypedilum vanderplanki TaxID=319348 RepID=A0A9J6BM48_POLVA|nr:hypothetical protein PVAND_000795 [Polypedilum vanderplanki]
MKAALSDARLREISEESVVPPAQPRRRSNSLPIPQIEISLYQGTGSPSNSSLTTKDYIEVPEPPISTILNDTPFQPPKSLDKPEDAVSTNGTRRTSDRKKRVKMADLRALIETKFLSKSDRGLEKIGENGKRLQHGEIHRSLDTGDDHLSRSTMTLVRDSTSNLVKGKSMPSLRYYRFVDPVQPKLNRSNQSTGQKEYRATTIPRNPIITVTEHTPTPSPEFMRRQGSIDSQLDAISVNGSTSGVYKSQMLRSQTDSHIVYVGLDENEVPGSSFYITKEGGIDYEVVLLAVYNVLKRETNTTSLRILETGLNICELLIDFGVLKLGEHSHNLTIGIIKRALLHLGCPNGCNDGVRGAQAEFLRLQCNSNLTRLLKQAPNFSKKYLRHMVATSPIHELIDFFHAFVGFCVDPSSLLSPLNNKRSTGIKSLNIPEHTNVKNQAGGQGYATNFGSGLTGNAEGQIIAAVFKALVTRFVDSQKELKSPENIGLYCEVRQLITYIKGAHGGPFRRVALSGILSVTPRPHKKGPQLTTTRVIRHIPQTGEIQTIAPNPNVIPDDRAARKLYFKKRSTSSACASLLETDGAEEQVRQSPLATVRRKTQRPTLTPRHSERTLLNDSASDRASLSRLTGLARWFRSTRDQSVDIEAGATEMSAYLRKSSVGSNRGRPNDGIGRQFQRARRRVERRLGRFGLGKGKKKVGGIEEISGSYFSHRSSVDLGDGPRESEVVILKERRLIPTEPVREGMMRFSFLLETCAPGSVPDPQLIGAILDLPQAPLIARATFLLECAHYVHLCNRGQWPTWMKQNLPSFRPSGPIQNRASVSTSIRRVHILQRQAGKTFFQWAECIGIRLEEMIKNEKSNYDNIQSSLNDVEKQKQLNLQDEEEDFLDELSVNIHGNDCPAALKLVAAVVLLEITAFLRETYQTIPKSTRMSHKEKHINIHHPWDHHHQVYKEANRRWSMALSSMGHSQTSAQSLQSIAGEGERKISFVLHEPDNESEGSSNTTLTMQGIDDNVMAPSSSGLAQRRPVATVRPFLLRRGTATNTTGGSFKRRSLKLRRNTKEGKEIETEYSMQSRRKVSSLSDRSDNSEHASGGEEESPGILSDDHEQPPDSPNESNDSDETSKNFPWMRAVIAIINSFNYYCTHQNYCHPYCYKRHMRAASRLIKSVRKIYGEEFGLVPSSYLHTETAKTSNGRREKSRAAGRKISDQSSSHTSPSRRKDSTGRRDRIIHDDSEQTSSQYSQKIEEKKQQKESALILKYVKNHVRDLFHVTFSAILKGAVILTEDQFIEIIPAAWELLLETNQETSAASAAFFILASVKAPSQASELMQKALKHKDPNVRIGAILRYQVLWKSRFQVWPRMEEGAHMTFKVPPPGIEFTLPSPKIGIECLPVVDPPWAPRQQNKDMDVEESSHRHFVTTGKSRKKQQTDAIRHAMQQQEDKQRLERHSFLITTIPVVQQAAHERLDHTPDDHADLEEEDVGRAVHLHAAHSLFPSILCSSVMQIVGTLDDCAVGGDGTAVYEVAYQVIWQCLVEDSALFLRYVLERLTREKQDQQFKLLRHLIRFVPRLPQQAAFALYNYIVGYIMFYVRTTQENSQQLVGSALSILWMVVHSVHGIMFKDLKQILRKEQCDASVLLTANVPSAKKIIVHGPDEKDEGSIPSQFPVLEDTQFLMLQRESLDFFGIEEKNYMNYFLIDYKTQQILNSNWFVRDLYFFKRSQYPQLRLVEMKPDEAFIALQRQELIKKFVEIGKVHLTWAILKNVDMVVQRVVFLHEELMKLPSFPRKALETDLDLYNGGELGKELQGLDVLHKFMWVRLIARMFEAMAGNFAYSADIQLFLNVLAGAAFLHAEDCCIMRYVMATFINAAFNFKNIFSTNGYFMIMPTLLQIYSLHQTNKLITTTIEYAVKQFYLMNRKPFILQMFGSVSAILDTDEDGAYGEASKVQSSCLFNLLLSLETPSPDPLNIAELVKEPKPLKAIDFCYHDEDEMVTVLDCITLCVMTVSYSAESLRGYQMLIILEAILPCYMQQIQSPNYFNNTYISLEGKCEKDIIMQLAITIRTMVHNCEGLSKSYNGPYRNSPEHKGSSQRNQCSRGLPPSPGFDFEEESHSKYVSEMGRGKNNMPEMAEDSELVRTEYRRPRDVLLSLVGEFLNRATTRLQELSRKPGADSKYVELLDVKCHIRLADIAHSLLKVSPYDPDSMACRGLQRYMTFILPRADWSDEKMRTALVTILRRLDKVFLKISKKPSIRRNTDWEAASGLLKGIHETIVRCPFVLHWQQMRSLLSTVQNLVVNETPLENVSSASAALMSQSPPAFFCSTVIRLVSLQLVSHVDCFTLEQICGGTAEFSTQEKAEGFLMHLLIPLCLKICSGKSVSDIGELKDNDISFLVTVILNSMSPPSGRTAQSGLAAANRVVSDIRAGSLTFTGSRDSKRPARISSSLYQAAFLALKVLCVCFETRLSTEWPKIARIMRDLGRRNEAAPELWSFLEFVVTHRTPLYIILMPFILHKISQPAIGDHERHMQYLIRERLRGTQPSGGIKSRGCLLLELARELKDLRDEVEERRLDKENTPSSEPAKKESSVTVQPVEVTRSQQRPSLISILTGAGNNQHTASQFSVHHDSRCGTGFHTPSDTLSQQTLHPPRESLSSSSTTTNKEPGVTSDGTTPTPTLATCPTVISRASSIRRTSRFEKQNITGSVPHLSHSLSSSLSHHHSLKVQPPKLRFVSSVEFRDSAGETSTTPLSPDSPADDSSGETQKHRLQRSKGASRKTFRYKRGRLNPTDALLTSSTTPPSSAPPTQTQSNNSQCQSSATTPTNPPQPQISHFHLPPLDLPQSDNGGRPGDSWDSVSQTSSTSGYRDNYSFQTGLLSPDGSLNFNESVLSGNVITIPNRSSSQNSLLMLFEAQDEEDTLI